MNSVAVAALEALGEVATLPTVMELLKVEAGKYPRAVRSAARNAVANIQSRVGTGPSGGLAVSDTGGQEGALSASEERGVGAVAIHE